MIYFDLVIDSSKVHFLVVRLKKKKEEIKKKYSLTGKDDIRLTLKQCPSESSSHLRCCYSSAFSPAIYFVSRCVLYLQINFVHKEINFKEL